MVSCSEKRPSVIDDEEHLIRVVEYAFMGDCIRREQMVHIFAGTYCDSSDVQVIEKLWQSEEEYQNECFPTQIVDSCVAHGWFDLDDFEYTFDGLNAYDWIEQHWREHATVDVREVTETKSDKDENGTTYWIEYEVTFAPDKYDGDGGKYTVDVTFDMKGDRVIRWHITDDENGTYDD